MTKTENYHLPQWAAEDPVLRTDFNEAWAALDTGLSTAAEAAAAAQGTADAAQVTADTARAEAAALPYVTGSYTGTGSDVTVTLGFRPSFVIICGHAASSAMNTDTNLLYAFSATGGSVVSSRIRLTGTGFVACAKGDTLYPDLTISGRTYDYIAFR